jgi:hypothetical protein
MNLEARVTRGARHRQAVREEIPVFGDDVEQAQWELRRVPLLFPAYRENYRQLYRLKSYASGRFLAFFLGTSKA